jgi:hypothetical protein
MKTFYLFPTLLAVMIQMIANSQTSRVLPVLGTKNEAKVQNTSPAKVYPTIVKEETAVKDEAKIQNTSAAKVYPVVKEETTVKNETKVQYLSAKIYPTAVMNEAAVKESAPAGKENTKVDNNTFNYYNNASCYSTKIYAVQLLKEADELGTIESSLRAQARTKKSAEKTTLMKEADIILAQMQLKQIQASEINGKLSLEKFKANDAAIEKMIGKSKLNENIIDHAKDINGEAKHQMKLAKEMREESYAMNNNAAKLGVMNNAEEKENTALKKQDEVIGILKATAAIFTRINYELAMR